jgi:hypothetical protein
MAANVIDDASDFLDAYGRRIDICPTQPRRKQVTAPEDVWRQIAVAAVVTMEEASFLVTAQRAIDGIQSRTISHPWRLTCPLAWA